MRALVCGINAKEVCFLSKKTKSRRLIVTVNLLFLVLLLFVVQEYKVTVNDQTLYSKVFSNPVSPSDALYSAEEWGVMLGLLVGVELFCDNADMKTQQSSCDNTEHYSKKTSQENTEAQSKQSVQEHVELQSEHTSQEATELQFEQSVQESNEQYSVDVASHQSTETVQENHESELSQNAMYEYCEGSYYQTDESTTEVLTEHEHDFVISSSCTWYPEEGHYENVCVEEGYTEERYESYDKYCYQCGCVMDEYSVEELMEHSAIHGAYGTYQKVVETIYHEPVYEKVWVVDKDEYYEEEVVVECIECGYIQ